MGSVKNSRAPAWVPHGGGSFPDLGSSLRSSSAIGVHPLPPEPKEDLVLDLVYIGLTIVVFAALWLLVKGVERFER